MSNQTSIARPYAKALFEHAISTQNLSDWSRCLTSLNQLMDSSDLIALLKNPAINTTQQAEIILTMMNQMDQSSPKSLVEFIQLLAANKRLFALSEIAAQFDVLKSEHERTLSVVVNTFSPLSEKQVQRLTESLSARLGRKVTIEQLIDKSLLGGAVIRANNLVIDGSVKSQLMKLAAELAA